MLWETLHWIIIETSPTLMFFHRSVVRAQAKEIKTNKIFSEARKGLPKPPLPTPPATSDSSKSNTFTNLKRGRFHSCAENTLSFIVQQKRFRETECHGER